MPSPPTDSGWDSDEDSDHEASAMSIMRAAVDPGAPAPSTEDRLRAHQILRGAASGKRVASRKALTSLETMAISDLPKNERSEYRLSMQVALFLG